MPSLRVGRFLAFALVILVAVVISLDFVTGLTVGPSVVVQASPNTINVGGSTTLEVVVSNPRNITNPLNLTYPELNFTYSQVNITIATPLNWNISDLTPLSNQTLFSGQSFLAEYRITTPANVSQGSYVIPVRVTWNQTDSAIYPGQVSIQYVLGPSLPGDVPFALAVIILPGFIAFAIGVYLGGSKLSDRSVLQLIFVSILLGAFIWQTGQIGFILATSNVNIILSVLTNQEFFKAPLKWYELWAIPNPQNIWVRTALAAVAIAAAAKLGGWVSSLWEKASEVVGAKVSGGVEKRWRKWVSGYEDERLTAWQAQIRSAHENKRGYRTKVTLTFGQQQQAKTANKAEDKPTETTASGLFIAADPKDPLNVILDPQYIVEDADRELLASSAPFWLRAKIRNKEAKPEELGVILRENGTIVENALRRAMLKNKKVTCLFLNGRTLIREPVLRWEMCPQREPLAKFVIEGLAIPSSEIVAPEGVYLALSLLKPNQEKAKKHSQQQIDKMTTKLSQTGQTAAVCVDKNLRIVDGHLTYLAAKKLGQDTVRVRILDSDEGKEES